MHKLHTNAIVFRIIIRYDINESHTRRNYKYMNHFLLLSWEFVVNTAEIFLFTILVFNRLTLKETLKKQALLSSVFLIFMITFINMLQLNLYISIFIILTFEVCYSIYFFTNSITEKLFWGSCFVLITILSEKITFGIFSMLPIDDINSLLLLGENRLHATILYLCTCAALVFGVTKFHKTSFELPIIYKVLFMCIIAITIIGSNILLGIILDMQSYENMHKYIKILNLIYYSFILAFFSFIFIIRKMGILYNENLEMQTLKQKIEIENKQLEMYQNTTQILRNWKHDYQNHIDVMWNLLQNSQYNELSDYMHKFYSEIPDSSFLISTGNTILDAVISMKFILAKQKNISFQYQIVLPDMFHIDNLKFSSLLGNILDNSIEACEYCNNNPYIRLNIKPYHDMLYLKVINSTDGNYIYNKQKELISRKHNQNHGIGLKRIHQIITELEGFYEIYPCNSTFTIKVLIPTVSTNGEH